MKIDLTLRKISAHDSGLGVCSVPVLPGLSKLSLSTPARAAAGGCATQAGATNVVMQSVPVGFWPVAYLEQERFTRVWEKQGWRQPPRLTAGEEWPRRMLTYLDVGAAAPPEVTLAAESATQGAVVNAACAASAREPHNPGWQVRLIENADIRKRVEQTYHYCRGEGRVELLFQGKTCSVRFGFQLADRTAHWQWVNAQRLWGGPLAEAWQLGGHIYAGKCDRPLTPQEAARWHESEFAAEQAIMVKAFVILLRNGCADFRVHFINGELYGRGGLVCGKPLVAIESADGVAARDVVASLYDDGLWRSGAGVGPFWGVNALPGTPWNGAHLLAGLAEFLIRSPAEAGADPLTPELLEGGGRLLRMMLAMLAGMDHFHRATGSFAWRRHYYLAQLIGDRAITEGIRKVLLTIITSFEREGEKFFDMGHHCAGYIDNPWFFLGCEGMAVRPVSQSPDGQQF